MKNKCLLLLLLCIAFYLSHAQQITFRTSYNIALIDIPGNIVQNPQKNYVMAGTNTSFVPLYGNVTQLDTIGNIMWSRGYQSGIATELLDIKNTTGGGYITTGSTGSGALVMKLDAAGAVTWSNTYSYTGASQEAGSKVIQASDGGYVIAGYVYDADPDGAGALARQDSANLFCMKVTSTGALVWAKTFFVSTTYINDHSLSDVAEVSDGYIFTGSSSDSGNDDDGRSAIILKTDKAAGTLLWARRYTAADDANAVVATTASEVLVSGSKAGSGLSAGNLYYIRVSAAGALVSGSGNQYGFSGIGTAVIPDNVVLTNDGNYAFTGTYINPFGFLFAGYTMKINPSSPATPLFTKAYNAGFSTLFSKGIQAVDSGYISVSLAQQTGGFNYHVVKTDKNGNMNDVNCDTIVLANPNRSTFTPTLNAMTLTELSGAPATSVAITVATLSPTQVVECLVVPCTPPTTPTATATPATICAGQQTVISGSGSGSGVTYRVYDSGGTFLGNAPLTRTPTTTTTYLVDALNNSIPGCYSARASVTVTVNQPPAAVGTVSGAAAPCPGSQTYTIGAVSGATSYTWSVSGGGNITTQSGTSATINWTTPGTYTVSVTATNSCGSTVGTLAVNVQAGPPASVGAITGSTTPCPGNQTYSINPVANATSYTWSVSAGGTILGGQGTSSISVNWATTGGPYVVSVTVANACGSIGNSVNVNVQPGAPVAPTAITGSTDVCIGNQGYSVAAVSGATGYTWSVSGGGSVTGGQSTTNATINWTTAGTYTVSVTATNPCGSSTATTLSVNVTAAQPTGLGTITGTSPICSGLQTYTVGAATGGTSYTWTVGAPGTIQTGQGTTSITVNWPATAGTYPVSVVANNVCGSSASASFNVTVAGATPTAPAAITGNNAPCPGIQNYTIAAVSGATNYTWSVSGGGTIVSGQGTTTIGIDWTTTGGPYTISVTADNACGSSAATTYTVNVSPGSAPVPGAIVGDTAPCPSAQAYSIPTVAGATGYVWTVTGTTISSGQGTNSIGVNWATPGGPYTVSVIVNGSCSNSVPVNLTVNVQPGAPAAPGVITGQTTGTCGNDTGTYSIAAVPNATSYTWTLSGGGAIVSGQGTTAVDIFWGSTPGTYTLSVTATNACGTSTATSVTVTVTAPAPIIATNITGEADVCPGTVTYSIANVPNATGYTWTVTAGGTIVSGQSTNSINVTWTIPGTQTVSVTASNSCGSSTAATLSVEVRPSPTQPTITTSDQTICEGEQVTITASGSTGGNVSYGVWDAATGGNLYGSHPLTITLTQTTTFYIEASNQFGCTYSAGRIPVTVNVIGAPTVLNISGDNDTICYGTSTTLTANVSPTGTTVSWWDSPTGGTQLASGATYNTGILTADLIVYAEASSSGGCNSLSGRTPATVVVTALPDITLTSDKDANTVFPNEVMIFTASPEGYSNYEFFINGVSVQSGTGNTYSSSSYMDKDVVSVLVNGNGCTSVVDSAIVKVTDFPNVFTPNGDNVNDIFLKDYDLVVVNRWGQKMYEGVEGWDGTYNGEKVSPGTYYYVVTLVDITDRPNVIKGNVLLIQD